MCGIACLSQGEDSDYVWAVTVMSFWFKMAMGVVSAVLSVAWMVQVGGTKSSHHVLKLQLATLIDHLVWHREHDHLCAKVAPGQLYDTDLSSWHVKSRRSSCTCLQTLQYPRF